MEILIICVVAFIASGLTVFSGFGLGTILLPAFVLFFPLEISIALTAIVHFLNNLFKLSLWWKNTRWDVVLKFGIPAFLAAIVGAKALFFLQDLKPLAGYQMFGREFTITPIKLMIAGLMIIFVVLEMLPAFKKISFPTRYLPFGGILSGFLGGLSGHQGAFRSAFLIKCHLNKESFIATGIVIACLVDLSRLSIYRTHLAAGIGEYKQILLFGVLAAFCGVLVANHLVKKVTMQAVQMVIGVMIFIIALLLGAGLI